MALSDPIPVRFAAVADTGLSTMSDKTGLSKAELIRIAVAEFLQRVEESGVIVQRIYVDRAGPTISQAQQGDGVNTQAVNWNEAPEVSPPLPTKKVKYGKKPRKPKP